MRPVALDTFFLRLVDGTEDRKKIVVSPAEAHVDGATARRRRGTAHL
jgi:hypothetical protein